MEINKIYNEDCLITMGNMPNGFIDLTLTSPPYDDLRKYNGFSFDFENIAKELYRVTKEGGVLVWVVNDSSYKGNESGTSFKQALYFKEIGFNLGDTMIWSKTNPFNFGSNYFYPQSFEYMFIFTKGNIKTSNLIRDRVIKSAGKKIRRTRRGSDDYMEYDDKLIEIKDVGKRYNVWNMSVQSQKGHPAVFPEKLANDHIITWSNENDLVYDPFMGSGTVAKMCVFNKRDYIGSEISENYCKKIKERLEFLKK
jgi:DNA modification methylase